MIHSDDVNVDMNILEETLEQLVGCSLQTIKQ